MTNLLYLLYLGQRTPECCSPKAKRLRQAINQECSFQTRRSAMADNTNQTSQLTQVSARITAEVLLGKIRFPHGGGEPPYLFRLREIFRRFEKSVGRDNLENAMPEVREMMHTLADALFDAVTGVKSEETTTRLKKLGVPMRASVEMVVSSATGKMPRQERWNDELWHLRKTLEQIVALSISGLTMEDLRQGYDEVVHKVVDNLCDNWKVIVD